MKQRGEPGVGTRRGEPRVAQLVQTSLERQGEKALSSGRQTARSGMDTHKAKVSEEREEKIDERVGLIGRQRRQLRGQGA